VAIYPASISLEEAAGLARKHFRWFRKLMRPDMLHNWWTDQIAEHLEQLLPRSFSVPQLDRAGVQRLGACHH
jgi:hypothetical protein